MKAATLCVLPLCAAALFAQGPRGGFGPGEFGGFGGRGGGGPRTPVTGEPYSATRTLTTQQTLAGGNQISRTKTASVARDGQGRTSTSETITPPASSGKAAFTIETIVDPVGGYRYELNSATMVAIQTPLPKPRTGSPPPGAPPARPNAPEKTTTSLGTMSVNGVSATGTQVTETIPAGAIGNAQPIQIVRISWVSTDLMIPVEIKTSDPRFGSSDLEVTNIVESEPAASLFTVPSGYTIQQRGGRGPGGPGRRPGGAGRPPAQ